MANKNSYDGRAHFKGRRGMGFFRLGGVGRQQHSLPWLGVSSIFRIRTASMLLSAYVQAISGDVLGRITQEPWGRCCCVHSSLGFRVFFQMQITNRLLQKIAILKNLEILNLSHNYSLNDEALQCISESNFVHRLKELYLDHCFQITNEGVIKLING